MAGRMDDKKQMARCSFCNKTSGSGAKADCRSGGIYMRIECIEICAEIIDEELDIDKEGLEGINLLKPKEIKEFLDKYVIGQDEAEKDAGRCCIRSL